MHTNSGPLPGTVSLLVSSVRKLPVSYVLALRDTQGDCEPGMLSAVHKAPYTLYGCECVWMEREGLD
eukprot:362980-Chlamydomonas_euryale.AAC.9